MTGVAAEEPQSYEHTRTQTYCTTEEEKTNH